MTPARFQECPFPPIGKVDIEVRIDAVHFTFYLDSDEPIGFLRVTESQREEILSAAESFYKSILSGRKIKAPRVISG